MSIANSPTASPTAEEMRQKIKDMETKLRIKEQQEKENAAVLKSTQLAPESPQKNGIKRKRVSEAIESQKQEKLRTSARTPVLSAGTDHLHEQHRKSSFLTALSDRTANLSGTKNAKAALPKRSSNFEDRAPRLSPPASTLHLTNNAVASTSKVKLDPTPTKESPSKPDDRWDASGKILERLIMGPKTFNAPSDDPDWLLMEPNSGTHLSTRVMPHDDLQEHLADRYHVSPATLYSIAKLQPDRVSYDVPLVGDWVVIAVIADKRAVCTTRRSAKAAEKASKNGKVVAGDMENDSDDFEESEDDIENESKTLDDYLPRNETAANNDEATRRRLKKQKRRDMKMLSSEGKRKEEDATSRERKESKYISCKLVDLGGHMRTSGSNILNLILFESESSTVHSEGAQRKTYSGGSGGAFEKWWSLPEGTVVALLNPRILRGLSGGSDSGVMALTPENAGGMNVIGTAKNYGTCTAMKADGKLCKSWTDIRVANVCAWHLDKAVSKQRLNRAEFSVGSNGGSVGGLKGGGKWKAKGGGKPGATNAAAKTGLLPDYRKGLTAGDGNTVYSVGGKFVGVGGIGIGVKEKEKEKKEKSNQEKRSKRRKDLEIQKNLSSSSSTASTKKKKGDESEDKRKKELSSTHLWIRSKVGFNHTGSSASVGIKEDVKQREEAVKMLRQRSVAEPRKKDEVKMVELSD